jgi:hypothetical protein
MIIVIKNEECNQDEYSLGRSISLMHSGMTNPPFEGAAVVVIVW